LEAFHGKERLRHENAEKGTKVNIPLIKVLYFPLVFALYLALFQNVKRLGYLFLNIFAVKCHLISFF
jgi:hypothetical protein